LLDPNIKDERLNIDPSLQRQESEGPRDYEIFLDIKRSYENSLAKMDSLCKRLQNENRIERTKRLKYQKIAEEVQQREKQIVESLTSKYTKQMATTVAANRDKIAADYKFALESQKATVRQQMESLVSQNTIIKKLT